MSDPLPEALAADFKWRARRNRGIRRAAFVVSVGVVFFLIGGSLWANWIWTRAFSETCDRVPFVDLSIKDIVQIRRRSESYRKSTNTNDYFELSDKEISFLMKDMFSFDVWVAFDGQKLHSKVAYPVEGGCYNLDFRGTVQVVDTVAEVSVTHLDVGQYNVDSWVGGRSFQFRPEDLQGWLEPAIIRGMKNTESLMVRSSKAQLQLRDRNGLW